MKCGVIILAAGKGTRMKSDLPKVANKIAGKPMICYPVEIVRSMGASPICVVLGYRAEVVKRLIEDKDITFAIQEKQLGTAHAAAQAEGIFEGFDGPVMILYGDVPMITKKLLINLLDVYRTTSSTITVLSTMLDNPAGYGRVIKENDRLRIVEERDATDEEKKHKEINAGMYIVDSKFLFSTLPLIKQDNEQREYYLTDIVKLACENGKRVTTYCEKQSELVLGVNSSAELAIAEKLFADR